jgi:membrane protease YdiL (CAAX protease family)
MKVFLTAGLLYLIGISVILILKPSLMFREDGTWKEFGIGRDAQTHTILPLWLFCIVWALVSYTISIVLFKLIGSTTTNNNAVPSYSSSAILSEPRRAPKLHRGSTLPEGYYVLVKSDKPGSPPTYAYLGEEA